MPPTSQPQSTMEVSRGSNTCLYHQWKKLFDDTSSQDKQRLKSEFDYNRKSVTDDQSQKAVFERKAEFARAVNTALEGAEDFSAGMSGAVDEVFFALLWGLTHCCPLLGLPCTSSDRGAPTTEPLGPRHDNLALPSWSWPSTRNGPLDATPALSPKSSTTPATATL